MPIFKYVIIIANNKSSYITYYDSEFIANLNFKRK